MVVLLGAGKPAISPLSVKPLVSSEPTHFEYELQERTEETSARLDKMQFVRMRGAGTPPPRSTPPPRPPDPFEETDDWSRNLRKNTAEFLADIEAFRTEMRNEFRQLREISNTNLHLLDCLSRTRHEPQTQNSLVTIPPVQPPRIQSSEPRVSSPLRQQPIKLSSSEPKSSSPLGDAQTLSISRPHIKQACGEVISATGGVKKRRQWKRKKILMRNKSLLKGFVVSSELSNTVSVQRNNTHSVSAIDTNLSLMNIAYSGIDFVLGDKLDGVDVTCYYVKSKSYGNIVKQHEQDNVFNMDGSECHALHLLDKMPLLDEISNAGKNTVGTMGIRDKGGGLLLQLSSVAAVMSIQDKAAAVSLALGIKTEGLSHGWYDGGSIAFAVFLVIVVTPVSDYRQSLQFQNLNEEKQNIQLEVMRGGRTVKISIFDIVVGDVVPLRIGDQVPTDGILITGHSLAIDESSMTGESKIVQKDQKAPFLMSGCKVADGVGTMLVTSVGINTEWGLLMASISKDTGEETPLQVRLNGLATFIGIVGLLVAAVVLLVLWIRYFTGNTKHTDGNVEFESGKTSFGKAVDGAVKIFTIAVTIVVVAVPEGLPLAVTLTLVYSMKKMMADKALVRRLSACEIMGSATTICSDKTGTLTLNQMTVVEAYVGRNKMHPPDDSSQLHSLVSTLLSEGIAQNTSGNVFEPGGGEVEISGSPTEKAILSWAVKLGMKFDTIRSESTILHVFPFNSEKKRGGVAVKVTDSKVHIHWKGAAEMVLASCTEYLESNGCLQDIKQDKKKMSTVCLIDQTLGVLVAVGTDHNLASDLQILPQERQCLGKVIDIILSRMAEVLGPCVHHILLMSNSLLVEDDYYARAGGRDILSNFDKTSTATFYTFLESLNAFGNMRFVASFLVDSYTHSGTLKHAYNIHECVIIWASMINEDGMHGHGKEGVKGLGADMPSLKETELSKLVYYLRKQGKSCMVDASDENSFTAVYQLAVQSVQVLLFCSYAEIACKCLFEPQNSRSVLLICWYDKRAFHKLSAKFYGPFEVLERIGAVAYKLKLPPTARIHNVFHVSLLKKKLGDNAVVEPQLPAIADPDNKKWMLAAILETRTVKKGGAAATQWLVHWMGSSVEEATWEFADMLMERYLNFKPEFKN